MRVHRRFLSLLPAIACLLWLAPALPQQNPSKQTTRKAGQSDSASKPDDSKSSGQRTEKVHFKQEFGPTQASKRGEKTKNDSSGGQGNSSQGTTGGTTANHASKGTKPAHEEMHGNHKDVMTQPPSDKGSGKASNSK
jgi:hypothetical protein